MSEDICKRCSNIGKCRVTAYNRTIYQYPVNLFDPIISYLNDLNVFIPRCIKYDEEVEESMFIVSLMKHILINDKLQYK